MTEQAPEPAEKPAETPTRTPAEKSAGTPAQKPAEAPGRTSAVASAGVSGQTSARVSGQESAEAFAARPFLYVVVCAAGVAEGVGTLIAAARERGWEVGVVATPVAMNGFFDSAAVQTLTGRPVRSTWRTPADPRPFPPPDAVAVAPATFNTINKWAAGIADTLAAATLCEAHGLGVPVVALPCVAHTLAAHPAYHDSLTRLRAMGVRFGDPHTGEQPQDGGRPAFAWERALDLLDAFPDGPRPRPASVIRYDRPA